uniref:Uncharacterized protein n=2 Tax=Trichogramma kaykai TaxID=54128 RepID=A0ABD2WRR7_9HYME
MCPLPNLQDILCPEEIEYLLSEAVDWKCAGDYNHEGKQFIEFVALTGYKDEDYEVDKKGKPLLCRKIPVHQASGYLTRGVCDPDIHELFKIYNRFDVNYIDSESGLTHFHVAYMSGCDGTVRKFLKLGQDPNFVVQKTGDSPLHLALMYDHIDVVQLLLRRGADPNLAHADELTPLHILGMYGHGGDIAQMLFEISIGKYQPVDAQDKLGHTTLHVALSYEGAHLAKYLIIKGANLNLSDAERSTPLHLICPRPITRRNNDRNYLVKLFFNLNYDKHQFVSIDAKDKLDRTALHLAARSEQKSNFYPPSV